MCTLNITNLILHHILFTLYIIFFYRGDRSNTELIVKKLINSVNMKILFLYCRLLT